MNDEIETEKLMILFGIKLPNTIFLCMQEKRKEKRTGKKGLEYVYIRT